VRNFIGEYCESLEISGYPIRPRVRGKPLRCCARPDQ
jgi:hypothetical protein